MGFGGILVFKSMIYLIPDSILRSSWYHVKMTACVYVFRYPYKLFIYLFMDYKVSRHNSLGTFRNKIVPPLCRCNDKFLLVQVIQWK